MLLELSLTRVFSVVFYYHFAFLAISIALFGLGAGGVCSYLLQGRRQALLRNLGWLSGLNALLVVVALSVVLGQKEELTNLRLAAIYLTTASPFFVAGMIVSSAISETVQHIDRVYFFDLLGAAGGCLLLIPLLNQFGGPNTVIAAGVLYAAAAGVWHNMAGSVRGRVFSVALALALVVLVAVNSTRPVLDVRYAKGMKLQGEEWIRWNHFSRIALAPERESGMKSIFIDADASTGIADFDFENLTDKQRQDLLFQGPGLPYQIRPEARTLIIGPGGGWDVARALAAGSRDITGVEINPLIATTIMREKFPHYSRGLYLRPDVHIFVEDGRSFIRRTDQHYEVIQATLVDTWASTAAGAFALSENNLYTTEAFVDYFNHLTPKGILAFTRWGFRPPRESLRLVSLAMAALGRLGESEPWQHVLVAREWSGNIEGWGARDTVLFSRAPLTQTDLARAREAIAQARMELVYSPEDQEPNAFTNLLRSANPEEFMASYPFDITPVTDDRPFFFYTVQPQDLWNFLTTQNKDSADYKINRAVPLLFGLLGIALAATVVILALPPMVLRTKLPRERSVLAFLLFFLCIGIGYILIEVALIQKFVLFLGHPTYALTVVIFSMLVSSGIGSFVSHRVIADDRVRLTAALTGVAALIGLLAIGAPMVLLKGVVWPMPLKILVAVLVIAPAGFLMGMPFPTGLRWLEKGHPAAVRWAWSLNAASSVLGSVLAMVFGIYLGLSMTMIVGGFLYLAAIVAMQVSRRLEVALSVTPPVSAMADPRSA